jgi:hypothetical protein
MKKRKQNRDIQPQFKRPQLNLKKDTQIGVAVVFFVVLSILFTLSLVGSAGKFGEVANQVIKLAFGWVAYVVPVIFLMVAVALARRNEEQVPNTVSTHAYVGAVLLTLTLTGFLHLLVVRSGADAFEMVKGVSRRRVFGSTDFVSTYSPHGICGKPCDFGGRSNCQFVCDV